MLWGSPCTCCGRAPAAPAASGPSLGGDEQSCWKTRRGEKAEPPAARWAGPAARSCAGSRSTLVCGRGTRRGAWRGARWCCRLVLVTLCPAGCVCHRGSALVPVPDGSFPRRGLCHQRPSCAFSVSTGSRSPFGPGHRGVFPVDTKRVRTRHCPRFSLGTNKNEPFQCFSPLTPQNWNLFLPLKELTC